MTIRILSAVRSSHPDSPQSRRTEGRYRSIILGLSPLKQPLLVLITLIILQVVSYTQSYNIDVRPWIPTPVPPGGFAFATVTITPSNGYTGFVLLSCAATGPVGVSSLPPCLGMPPFVFIITSSNASVEVLVPRETVPGPYFVSVHAMDLNGIGPTNGAQSVTLNVSLAKPSDVFMKNSAIHGSEIRPNPDPNLVAGGSVIANNIVVRGWLTRIDGEPDCQPPQDPTNCAVEMNTQRDTSHFIGDEDVHYNVLLDPDFISDSYGYNGSGLSGAWLPGNEIDDKTEPIPMQDIKSTPSVNINSFWLPNQGPTVIPLSLHTELNAWHQRRSWSCFPVCKDYEGRAQAPAQWREKDYLPTNVTTLPLLASDNWWPFDPDNPDNQHDDSGVPHYLVPGDYVEVQGTLWQDTAHETGNEQSCWSDLFHNQDGHVEIHPVDRLTRLNGLPPPLPAPISIASARAGAKQVIAISICSDAQGVGVFTTNPWTACPEYIYGTFNPTRVPGGPYPYALVPHIQELIDWRFTLSDITNIRHTRTESPTPTLSDCVWIDVGLGAGNVPLQHFKATYVVWWSAPGPPPPPTLSDPGPCPWNVTLRDQDPNAHMYYTTDGSMPTTSSMLYSAPITVNSNEFITALAVNNYGQSSALQLYTCAPYDYVDINIATGNDDARSDSEVDATLNATVGTTPLSWSWTLKPQNGPDPCDSTQNAWNPRTTCHQGFSIFPGVPLFSQFQSITITLGEHPGWLEGWDNWDIQGITVTAYANGEPKVLLDLSNPRDPRSPNNCYTRLKHGPGLNTVTYTFGGNNPSNGCPQ